MKNYKSDQPCIVCGESRDGYVTFHHIYSQKVFSEYKNSRWNLAPLCAIHHLETHNIGEISFMNKYQQVKDWMELNGWELFNGKLIHKD
jgi:hypothetical protein